MKTVTLRPSAKIDLNHRLTLVASAPAQSLIVGADDYRSISVLQNDIVVAQFAGFPNTHAISVHPFQPLIAIVNGDENPLSIVDTQGEFVIEPPDALKSTEYSWNAQGGGACYFEPQGNFLWSAVALSRNLIEVQVRDCVSWQIIHRVVLETPFGKCNISFHPTSDPLKIILWAAEWQDGQILYWLTREPNGISWTLEPRLDDMCPPVFVGSGNQFLVTDMDNIIHYNFPDGQEIQSLPLPWDEEEGLGGFIASLDNIHVLIDSADGRLFVIELNQMELIAEVVVERYEPRPTEEIYPTLKGDKGLCTKLSYQSCIGDRIIAGYRRDNGVGNKDWKTTVLCLDMPEIRLGLMS